LWLDGFKGNSTLRGHMKRIALVVNPIAGMGGRVGLKGTDGVVDEAYERGAIPRANDRTKEALSRLKEAYDRYRIDTQVEWFTASGEMGENVLSRFEEKRWTVNTIHVGEKGTTAKDTKAFVRKAVEGGAELVVFCGGDGTARDVYGMIGTQVPMFGIPAGVKMHSGVFATDPTTAGELLEFYIRGEMTTGEGEILDLDEKRYRDGEWNIALFGTATTLYEPSFIQMGKFMVEESTVEDSLAEIVDHMAEFMEEEADSLFVLGPGGTLERIGGKIGIDKTHLGVDLVLGKRMVEKDCRESAILSRMDELEAGVGGKRGAFIVVSPIGGQGFYLGRGNLQISPPVIKKVGIENIMVVSVPQKLDRTRRLRVDTGDHGLDERLREQGSIKVLTGYRSFRMKRIE